MLTDQSTTVARMSARQRTALAVLLTAGFTLAVDFSILNVALPKIGDDVGFALEHLQWIATSYALCAAGCTLLFGRIADLFGRRRLFVLGVALLGASSLAGGLAQEPTVLLIARVLQGLATAMVAPAALALLTTSFPEGPQRQRALGLNGSLMAAGFTTGAILGGVLTDVLSWRWAFFINVVVAVLVLAVAPTVLDESRPRDRPKVDVPGAVTVTTGLLSIVYGLTAAGETGWTNSRAFVPLAAGFGLLGLFLAVERRAAQPLVPITVLRRRSVAVGNVAGLLAFATETSLVFLLTLYMQEVLGLAPLATGLAFAVLGAGTVVGGLAGPRIIARVGATRAISGGLLVQAVATLSLVTLGGTGGWMVLLLAMTFLGGVANLAAIVGFMVTATTGLPAEDQGLATGLATMSQQIGITLGTPIMSAVALARMRSLGEGTAESMLSGLTFAIGVNAALCAMTAVVVQLTLGARKRKETIG